MKALIPLTIFLVIFVLVKNLPILKTPSEGASFQKAAYYETVSLNYKTFVVSLLWVKSMIGFGESLRNNTEKKHILDNGLVLSEIDPKFRKLYDWFPAIPLNDPSGPQKSDFEKLDTLMNTGVRNIDDPGINFSAAINHIGYNGNLSDEEKLHFYGVAAQFLEPILAHPKAPDRTSGVYSYFKKGGHFKRDIDPEEEVAFLSSLLFSTDQIDREPILLRLSELGYSDALEKRRIKDKAEYEERKKRCCSYLSDDLSMAYGF